MMCDGGDNCAADNCARSNDPNSDGRLLDAALTYARLGWSVIPLKPRDKKPLISWAGFQSRIATEEEICGWFGRCLDANLGIVTGGISKLAVLDFDGKEGAETLRKLGLENIATPVVHTGKGTHIYCVYPREGIRNSVGSMPGFDIRGDGGYVVAPPSIHPTGKRYAFVGERDCRLPLAEIPHTVKAFVLSDVPPANSGVKPTASATTGPVISYARAALEGEAVKVAQAPEGQRNETLNRSSFKLGQLVGTGILLPADASRELLKVAEKCGLPLEEAVRTIQSGMSAGMTAPRVMREGHNASHLPKVDNSGSVAIENFRLDRLTEGAPPTRRWLVKDAIPLGVPGVLYGPGGVGKSMAALDLCLKVAVRANRDSDSMTFLGPVPKEAAGAAVFITLEDDKAEIHRRTAGLDPHNHRDGAPCYVLPTVDVPELDPVMISQGVRAVELTLFAQNGLEALLERISKKSSEPVRLLVLDPAGDLISGDEDSAMTVKPLMRRLREIARKFGCTIILLGHVAKGVTDRDNLAARQMRGSGAWTANSRFAIGFYAPDDVEKAKFLRQLSIEPTRAHLDRVVYGAFTKSNYPGAPPGVLRYLRDPQSGIWVDRTATVRSLGEEEREAGHRALLEIVRKAAEVGLPFQVTGRGGLHKRREELPKPLCEWGEKRLIRLANEALENGLLVKCRAKGSSAPCWLDEPNGPYATGRRTAIEVGSLKNALVRKVSPE